ncbi:unnamed protein product [Scytosiphon promiscuus]
MLLLLPDAYESSSTCSPKAAVGTALFLVSPLSCRRSILKIVVFQPGDLEGRFLAWIAAPASPENRLIPSSRSLLALPLDCPFLFDPPRLLSARYFSADP